MKKVKLVCENCGKEFERAAKEHKRNSAKGRRVFCSLSCAAHANHQHLKQFSGNVDNLKPRKQDELSPFRETLRRVRARDKENNLTLEYLQNIWKQQKGICPYTGIEMGLPIAGKVRELSKPNTASLDRIDSSKGYIQGNVEFICLFINFGKNHWCKKEIVNFLNSF